ncbi:MAG: hypothetical protein NZ954_00710 [Thermofilaceae archaeon]|nr:hypothetical protein [Thermofilaceae archaeon]MCX8180298.1 hypothetical protein [Thermofilaceae archaeon]MDW8003833.1 hypothetical protein [Thermofilaceae archaeon]
MEAKPAEFEQLKAQLDEALELIEASKAETLLAALRRLSSSTTNPLQAYIWGEELVIAVGNYSILNINISEGKVRTWEDWRTRLEAAAKEVSGCVARRLMVTLLDKGEGIPSKLRDEISQVLTSVEKTEGEDLKRLLEKLRYMLNEVSEFSTV